MASQPILHAQPVSDIWHELIDLDCDEQEIERKLIAGISLEEQLSDALSVFNEGIDTTYLAYSQSL